MNNNMAVLTQSHKAIAAKKRAKKDQIKEILFDDDARRDFLTGFHKRKLAKTAAAKAKAVEREKQDRLESRREQRRELAQRATENAAEVEAAWGALAPGGPESRDDDGDWEGIPSSSRRLALKGKAKAASAPEVEEEYEDEEMLATVTVIEDFDPDVLIHGPKIVAKDVISNPNGPAEPELPTMLMNGAKPKRTKDGRPWTGKEGIGKQAKAAAAGKSNGSLVAMGDRDSTKGDVGKSKTRAKSAARVKKVSYESKSARMEEKQKQRVRRTEKAERAGGKASRKRKVGGKKW